MSDVVIIYYSAPCGLETAEPTEDVRIISSSKAFGICSIQLVDGGGRNRGAKLAHYLQSVSSIKHSKFWAQNEGNTEQRNYFIIELFCFCSVVLCPDRSTRAQLIFLLLLL